MLDHLERQLNLPTPIEEVRPGWLLNSSCRIFVKRDDLIHPHMSGNKWRKLKYNLLEALQKNAEVLVTYGGAYSNHLVAVAAAGHYLRMRTIGAVRTYQSKIDNPTTEIVRSYGMELSCVPPKNFNSAEWRKTFCHGLNEVFEIPEGGTNALSLQGVREMTEEQDLSEYSHIVVAIGTGGTLAGLATSRFSGKIVAVSPFKNHNSNFEGLKFLSRSIAQFEIINSVLNSKFGSFDPRLIEFANDFYNETQILLDPIYTTKAMMTLASLIETNQFKPDAKILFIHTGGTQGIMGFNHRFQSENG